MKTKEKVLIILFVLAIICIVGIAVHRKSSNPDTQETSSISDAQENSTSDAPKNSSTPDIQEKHDIPDTQEKSSSPDMQEKNGASDTRENYEDSSEIVQLILTGDMDIDMYSQDELKYYYHPNSEDYQKAGPHIRFDNAGKLGDQDIVIAHFNKECYTIKLSSNKNQISQIGILADKTLQALSDFSLKEGDVVEILYSPEKTELRYNNKQINFDENRSLLPEDVEQ